MPAAGELRDRVTFQRRSAGPNVGGVTRTAYADLFSRAAKLAPTRGGEQVIAGRLSGQASWDLWVRQDSGTRTVKVGDRVVDARDSSRVFDIRFIGDIDNRREFFLMQLQSGGSGQ